MTLRDIPAGSRILIDANILIFARRKMSIQCEELLLSCARGELFGSISILTLAEICHRRMIQEAQSVRQLGSNPARRLSEQRLLIGNLSVYSQDVRDLLRSGLEILPLEPADFEPALNLQKSVGLLTNDSLILAAAIRRGIENIATADESFVAAQGISVFRPSDIQLS
jgi:predicted nucleic acid-binding protein